MSADSVVRRAMDPQWEGHPIAARYERNFIARVGTCDLYCIDMRSGLVSNRTFKAFMVVYGKQHDELFCATGPAHWPDKVKGLDHDLLIATRTALVILQQSGRFKINT